MTAPQAATATDRAAVEEPNPEDELPQAVATPLSRFPWPFTSDTFRYHTNVERAEVPRRTPAGVWGEHLLDIDEYAPLFHRLKQRTFEREPQRAQTLPHMREAAWDALLFVLEDLAVDYPDRMHLAQRDGVLSWRNDITGDEARFRLGDADALGMDPLLFAALQAQEDLQLLDDREGHLWVDALALAFTGTWSSTFSPGMSFQQIHGPVPRIHAIGMVDRTEAFLRRVPVEQHYRRLAWTVNVSDRLDVSLEDFPDWGVARLEDVTARQAWGETCLRVEVQNIVRLPMTSRLLFAVRTHLCPLSEIATCPPMAAQLASVLEELPADMASYKGFEQFRPQLIDWLHARLAESSRSA